MEKMRPQLFRMASELQPNEEGMSDIIQANDALIRVLDHYERVVGPKDKGQSSTNTPTTITTTTTTTTSTNASSGDYSSQNGSSGAKEGGSGGASDLLLDLADLNFGNPPTASTTNSNNNFGIPGQYIVCIMWIAISPSLT